MEMQEAFSMQRIPEVWPGWQADELIGQGAYGKVYRASRAVGGHVLQAAIKVIDIPQDEAEVIALKQMGMDALSIRTHFEDSAQLVMREIATMDVLKGAPNVVGIEDSQLLEHGDGIGWTILIRMELLEALPTHIERVGMPDQREAALIGVAMCNALQACHNAGIVHRDVKPTNVFWSRLGGYKLGDFGLARMMEAGSGSTKSRAGTDDYMAPEVITGHYDYRVDIYSLGCMVYRWLNGGKPPFVGASEIPNRAKLDEAQLRRLSGERPPLPAGAGVDPSLASIVRKAVEPRTEDRWQSASEFGGALQAWLDGKITVTSGPGGSGEVEEPIRMRLVRAEAIPDQLWAGEPVCPQLVLSYEGAPLRLGVDYTVSYADNTGPGEATAVARGMGRFVGQKTIHFTILLAGGSDPVRIRDVEVAEIPDQVWAGEPVCPKLSLSYEGEPLTAGFDYTVTYADNDRPGKASAVVEGQWRFTGQRTLHFTILPKGGESVRMRDVYVKSIPSHRWEGTKICPEVVVLYEGERLEQGQDYTVIYLDNDGPGQATVRLRGCGRFAGQKTVHFTITGKKTPTTTTKSGDTSSDGPGCLSTVIGIVVGCLLFALPATVLLPIPVIGIIWGCFGWIPCITFGFGFAVWLSDLFS